MACVLWGRKVGRLQPPSRFLKLLASAVWTPSPSRPGRPRTEGPRDSRAWG